MNVEEAKKIVGTDLGVPRKMPGFSFGLSAKDCVTGSRLNKVIGSVCNKCYAMRGNYTFTHMKAMYQRRLEGLYNPKWVEAMVTLIRSKQRIRNVARKSRRREVLSLDGFGRSSRSRSLEEDSGDS